MRYVHGILVVLVICGLTACGKRAEPPGENRPVTTKMQLNGISDESTEEQASSIAAASDSRTSTTSTLDDSKQNPLPKETVPDTAGTQPTTDPPKDHRTEVPNTGKSPTPTKDTGHAETPRMIIRNGDIYIEVEQLDSAIGKLYPIIRNHDSYIAQSKRESSKATSRTESFTLRIPVDKFDHIVEELRKLGSVKMEDIGSQEVTQEFVDGIARKKALEDQDAQLATLLKTHGAKLDEIIEIQDKRTEVRSQIELIEGRLRYLQNQSALSTLTVHLSEPGAMLDNITKKHDPDSKIGGSISNGIEGALAILGGMITLLITFLPLIIVGIIGWIILRPILRKRKVRLQEEAKARRLAVLEEMQAQAMIVSQQKPVEEHEENSDPPANQE